MQAYFASGHAADVMLAALALEAAWLLARGRRLGLVLVMLGPAALIVLGLRAALVGAPWPWIALPLALSLPIHLADPRLWQRAPADGSSARPSAAGTLARAWRPIAARFAPAAGRRPDRASGPAS